MSVCLGRGGMGRDSTLNGMPALHSKQASYCGGETPKDESVLRLLLLQAVSIPNPIDCLARCTSKSRSFALWTRRWSVASSCLYYCCDAFLTVNPLSMALRRRDHVLIVSLTILSSAAVVSLSQAQCPASSSVTPPNTCLCATTSILL